MASFLSIFLDDRHARFVVAESEGREPIQIVRSSAWLERSRFAALKSTDSVSVEDNEENSSVVSSPVAAPIPSAENVIGFSLDDVEYSRIILLSSVFTESVYLPFKDRRQIENTAPVQLQDSFPFDLDTFVVDSFATGFQNENNHLILSSFAPKEFIADALALCRNLGVEPRSITTGASILAGVIETVPGAREGNIAVLALHTAGCSLCALSSGTVVALRECPVSNNSSEFASSGEYQGALREARIAIERIEREFGITFREVLVVGVEASIAGEISRYLGVDTKVVDLSQHAGIADDANLVDDFLLSALSVIATVYKTPAIEFRRGEFAYKPTLGQIFQGFADEFVFIGWAAALLVLLGVTTLYTASAQLNRVNNSIRSSVQEVLPGEALPPGSEASIIESRVTQLEEQLRALGTLSAVSPLQSLRELAAAINGELDVGLESLSIAQSRLSFSGTVPDNLSVGRLSGALERKGELFCEVKVDPKGKQSGSNRVRFTADITFCE